MDKAKALEARRKYRVRTRIHRRKNDRFRLSVFRSSKNIYAQVIDDSGGSTIVAASTLDKEIRDFQTYLMKAGYTTMLRTTRGADIGAACGQLVGQVKDRTRRQARYLARVKAEEIT